jgi:hypothetical protein
VIDFSPGRHENYWIDYTSIHPTVNGAWRCNWEANIIVSTESQGTMGHCRSAIYVKDLSFLPYTVHWLCQELK